MVRLFFFFFFLKRACAGRADASCATSASNSSPGSLPGLLPSSSSAHVHEVHVICHVQCDAEFAVQFHWIQVSLMDHHQGHIASRVAP